MKEHPSSFHVFSSPSSPRSFLFSNNAEAHSEYNQLKFSVDSSDKDYDPNTLFNLLRREKKQLCSLKLLKSIDSEKQKKVSFFLNQIVSQFFKDDSDSTDIPSQLSELLKAKLLTLMFLEISLILYENIDKVLVQFFFYCSYNIALKSTSVLIINQDLLNWIEAQTIKDTTYWNKNIFRFEEFLNKKLDWNTDMVTSCDIFNYFLENHFIDLDCSQGFDQAICESDILTCYAKQQWSVSSIAIGCLSYHLKQADEQKHFEYLSFLLHQYSQESQTNDLFNSQEIQSVQDFLESEYEEASKLEEKQENDIQLLGSQDIPKEQRNQEDFKAQPTCRSSSAGPAEISLEAEEENLDEVSTVSNDNPCQEWDDSHTNKTGEETVYNKKRSSSTAYRSSSRHFSSFSSIYDGPVEMKHSFASCSTLNLSQTNSSFLEDYQFEDSSRYEPSVKKRKQTELQNCSIIFHSVNERQRYSNSSSVEHR